MTVIDLASRRQQSPPSIADMTRDLKAQFAQEGRDLGDLCWPIVKPYRLRVPSFAQHLTGGVIRWQLDRIRSILADDPWSDISIGLAIAITMEHFNTRMNELEFGIDPDDGGWAA